MSYGYTWTCTYKYLATELRSYLAIYVNMILSLNKRIYASLASQKFCVVVRTKHRWLAHMQKVHRVFAGRPLKLKWLPVLPIFLAFSRFPRRFEGQRYPADVLYIAIPKTIVTISI